MKICRAADLVPITREVAAAAVVPISSTSMKAFWIAFVTTRFSSENLQQQAHFPIVNVTQELRDIKKGARIFAKFIPKSKVHWCRVR